MPDVLTIMQFLMPIVLVIALSLISENFSPKIAGIISGYPLGTALILFFIGLENGNVFAAESALNSLAGISASLTMLYCYYLSRKLNSNLLTVKSILISITGFIAAGFVLQLIDSTVTSSLIVAITGILVFSRLFKKIENLKILNKVSIRPSTVLFRGIIAGSTTAFIVSISSTIGTQISGILASFPTTLLPLIIITDLTYGPTYAHIIIKNFAYGSGCLACYTLSVYFMYPIIGVYYGTLVAFTIATIYLALFLKVTTKLKTSTNEYRKPVAI